MWMIVMMLLLLRRMMTAPMNDDIYDAFIIRRD